MQQSPEQNLKVNHEADALGVRDVAKSLGVSRATLLRWIKARKVEGFFRIGHKWLIRKSDFESFISRKVAESKN